ncbi:hypothetical protein H0H81_002848 [Sphagnurus paluster]|uniref:Uncharacterized protein n=1 Tax=Sphagnurus paluster TaxID=117069 RepID=A0A9P7FZ42_9AGAR|nr:hypothetical protein H0H81_002848 [Sphagnurus paluster]
MSNEKNKNRLWIYLHHRNGGPGYHWSLVLTSKSIDHTTDHADTLIDNIYRFHATNSLQTEGNDIFISPGMALPWRFEEEATNITRLTNVVGRVLVAKLPASTSALLAEQATYIRDVIRPGGSGGVAVVQNDPSWNCVSWAQDAMRALRVAGGEFSSIPDIVRGGGLEDEIQGFGDRSLALFLKKGVQDISSLPVLDLRFK